MKTTETVKSYIVLEQRSSGAGNNGWHCRVHVQRRLYRIGRNTETAKTATFDSVHVFLGPSSIEFR